MILQRDWMKQVSLYWQVTLIQHVHNMFSISRSNSTVGCREKGHCMGPRLTTTKLAIVNQSIQLSQFDKIITKLWFTECFFFLSSRSDGTKVEWSRRAAMVDVSGSLVSCDCWCTLAAPQDLVVMFGGCCLRCCCIREVVWGGPRGPGANTSS